MTSQAKKYSGHKWWHAVFPGFIFQRKIRNKLLFIVLALTAMNFIFFSFLAVRTKTSYIHWNLAHQNQAVAAEISHYINSFYFDRFKQVGDLIESIESINPSKEESFNGIYTDLTKAFPDLLAVKISHAKSGRIQFKGVDDNFQAPHDTSHDFTLPMSKGFFNLHLMIGKARFFPEFQQLAIPLRHILIQPDQKKQSYFITLYFSLLNLSDVLKQWRLPPSSEISIVNADGQFLIHPRLKANTKITNGVFSLHHGMNRTSTLPLPDAKTKFATTLNDLGIEVLRSYSVCTLLDWGVFVEQNANVLHRRVSHMRWIILSLLIGPLLFTLSLGLLFVHQVVSPLEELEDGIKLFESGLLAEPLPVRSHDETGRLTQAFNQMVHTLVTRNEEIQKKTRKLSFFNEITSIINQSIELNTFLDRGLRKILNMMQVSTGWIYVFDPQLKKLSLITYAGVPESLVTYLQDLSFADILMNKAYTSGKPSLIRDVTRHLKTMPKDSSGIIRDLLLVPLRSKKRIVGVLAIASNQKYFLHYQDLDQLTRIGSELGIAVENALLYIELQLKIKEREEVNKDLQEMDRFKNRILSNVSHELRTPITTIKTYTELFLSDKIGSLTEDQKEKLHIVSRNVNNLLNLINDLLTLARIQDQKMLLKNMEVLIIQDLVDTVIADTIEMANAKKLTLCRAGAKDPVMVRINRQKIQQVLQNLITNAIKFTETGSVTIELRVIESTSALSAQETDKLLEINVIDTGIGIPKKALKKIFQRFYQVDSSSTRKYVGTGLGLSIVKEILEAHGSTIQVDSTLNQGSRFWFALPLVPKIK